MTSVGVKRVATVIEPIIYYDPTVVGLITPLAYVYMSVRKQADT